MAIKFIDLFCGIGGFRLAMEYAARKAGLSADCVLSCDIDDNCRRTYEANFGEMPDRDITAINASYVPDHDILLAGFPCQPFSIIGRRQGFEDTRGTLFFEVARILEAKKPSCFVLENVKLLAGHDRGRTIQRILEVLQRIGYEVHWRVLNALDFGLPQKRERVFIVGFAEASPFIWPTGNVEMKPLASLLEQDVPQEFYASERIRKSRLRKMKPSLDPTIWHENKAGHISAYPYSCALRAGASYNYLLVNGERRLTPREMHRLQGFPDEFRIVVNYSQARKQAGNSLPVPVAQAVIERAIIATGQYAASARACRKATGQLMLFERRAKYAARAASANRRKVQAAVSS